jgi:SAM-dependent methyltransferase
MSPSRVQPSRKQDQKYWDTMASRWDDEIFNSLRHDKFRVIADELARSARGAHSVADFGCGVGVYLPLLGRLFDEVHGFERSPVCVAIARRRFETATNIAIHSATPASVRRHGRFDVVLCVNVAVHPAPRSRNSVMRALDTLLAPGGRLILVVPSLESATMVAAAEEEALRRRAGHGKGDWHAGAGPGGVVTIEGMPYKHYTRHELRGSLINLGLSVTRIRRVEYSWRSQGVRPGPAFRDKLPWDWMAVARRDKDR